MFGFPKQNKTDEFQYKKNYLQTVTFQVVFSKTESLFENQVRIQALLESAFEKKNDVISNQIDFTIKEGSGQEKITSKKIGLAFSNISSNSTFQITEEGITLTIMGKEYSCFEKVIDSFISNVLAILEILESPRLQRISIRKINVIDFIFNQEKPTIEAIQWVFNESFVCNLSNLPGNEYVKGNMGNILMQNNSHLLNLVYGLTYPDKSEGLKSALLDIDLINSSGDISATNLKSSFKEINDEIYNIFAKALSEKAKSNLDD